MLKLLLMSIVLGTVLVPSIGARIGDPRKALRFVLVGMGGLFLFYAFFLLFIYERLL